MDEDELQAWRELAALHLDEQAHRAAIFQTYYDGEEEIHAMIDTEERRTFRRLLQQAGANWCELIVNAVAERLRVVGFRFAGADADAWAIWQASHMDADSRLVQKDALIMGSSFVLVQPDADNPTGVEITAESPLEATVLYEPGSHRRRAAGYKRFGGDHAKTEVLILPDVIATWEPHTGRPDVAPNPAGEVGMIEIRPQPRTVGWPRSELTPCLPIQDRINTTIFARLVATDYAAFRQAWATGVKMARQVIRDSDGNEITRAVRPFNVGPDRLLINENPDGRFGSFPESTLKGYIDSVQQDVEQMAAITQTPPHYLLGTMINVGADAIKAAETGLAAKTGDRALFMGEDYEETMRCALRMIGHPAAADVTAEVVWADVETRSEGQRVDALVKMATLGVPRRVLWEKWGATPQEIARWEQLAAAEVANSPEAAYARLLSSVPALPPAG